MLAGTTSPDAMLSGDLPCAQREKWMKVNRCSRICVTQVSSPYKFWFQTETAVEKLKESMKGLRQVVVSAVIVNCVSMSTK